MSRNSYMIILYLIYADLEQKKIDTGPAITELNILLRGDRKAYRRIKKKIISA